MKKLVATLLLLGLLVVSVPAQAGTTDDFYQTLDVNLTTLPVTLHIDGRFIASDIIPLVENGRTLAPLRAATEALGATVNWDAASRSATVTKAGQTAVFTQNSTVYAVNGVAKTLDVPLQNKGGRIMVPLRALGESMNVDVEWDKTSRDVVINTGATPATIPAIPADVPQKVKMMIEKYYVPADASDPYVGSWVMSNAKYGTDGLHSYLFISKVGDNAYQLFNLGAFDDNNQKIMSFSLQPAAVHENNLVGSSKTVHLYYDGPAMGTPAFTEYFKLENGRLNRFKIVMANSGTEAAMPDENQWILFDRF